VSVYLRLVAKGLIARDVAAGRRSLVEAAALFRELDRLPPASIELARLDEVDASLPIPGQTEEERLCRHVLAYVRAALAGGEPDRAEAALTRLADEFFAERRVRGAIQLPAPDSGESVREVLARAREAFERSRWERRTGDATQEDSKKPPRTP
jgi:hypothetical protein